MGVSPYTRPLCTAIDSFNLPFQQLPCDPWKRRGAVQKEGGRGLSKCHVRHSRLLPPLTRLENSNADAGKLHTTKVYTYRVYTYRRNEDVHSRYKLSPSSLKKGRRNLV